MTDMNQNLSTDFEGLGLFGNKDQPAWLVTRDAGTLHIGGLIPQAGLRDTDFGDHKVFDRRAELKQAVSLVVMHLSQVLRNELFAEIDYLYGEDCYEEGEDAPIEVSSFGTFLRFMIYNGIAVAPLLGVSDEGYLLAAWRENNVKYYFEFLADDSIRLNYYTGHPDSEPTVTSSSGKSKNIMRDILPNTKFAAWQKEPN